MSVNHWYRHTAAPSSQRAVTMGLQLGMLRLYGMSQAKEAVTRADFGEVPRPSQIFKAATDFALNQTGLTLRDLTDANNNMKFETVRNARYDSEMHIASELFRNGLPLKFVTYMVTGLIMLLFAGPGPYQATSFDFAEPSLNAWIALVVWGMGPLAIGTLIWFRGLSQISASTASSERQVGRWRRWGSEISTCACPHGPVAAATSDWTAMKVEFRLLSASRARRAHHFCDRLRLDAQKMVRPTRAARAPGRSRGGPELVVLSLTVSHACGVLSPLRYLPRITS